MLATRSYSSKRRRNLSPLSSEANSLEGMHACMLDHEKPDAPELGSTAHYIAEPATVYSQQSRDSNR